jgi:hypothetical protein
MKKIYLTLASVIFGVFAVAQTFIITQDSVEFAGTLKVSEINGRIYLSNMGADPIAIRVIRTTESIEDGWETSFCNKQNCYPNSTDSVQFSLAKGNNSNYLLVHFYHNNNIGRGVVKLKVYNVLDPENSFDLTYIGEVTEEPSGLVENKSDSFSVFPNPVKKELYFKGNISGPVEYSIYDITGRQFISGTTNTGEFIDLEGLPKGVYFIRIQANNLEVKRFVKD